MTRYLRSFRDQIFEVLMRLPFETISGGSDQRVGSWGIYLANTQDHLLVGRERTENGQCVGCRGSGEWPYGLHSSLVHQGEVFG